MPASFKAHCVKNDKRISNKISNEINNNFYFLIIADWNIFLILNKDKIEKNTLPATEENISTANRYYIGQLYDAETKENLVKGKDQDGWPPSTN